MKTFDDFLTEASDKPSVQKGFIIAYEKQFETVYYREYRGEWTVHWQDATIFYDTYKARQLIDHLARTNKFGNLDLKTVKVTVQLLD